MIRHLYLVRHAKSDWTTGAEHDFDRPLNTRGHRDAPRMAEFMKQRAVKPDLLVSSPANRALTTAVYFATTYDIKTEEIVKIPSIYECTVGDLYEAVRHLPDSAETVFLFAHNSSLTYFANEFTENLIANIPTAGVVHLQVVAPSWSRFNDVTARVQAHWFPKEVL